MIYKKKEGMEENELIVKTRVLWSSITRKSNTKFKIIKRILQYRHKLEISQLRQELDNVSPGLFHLYNWVNNERSCAVYGCSLYPGTTFTVFEKLQIQLELWRYGENWEGISLKLFGDERFATYVQRHAQVSGIYS